MRERVVPGPPAAIVPVMLPSIGLLKASIGPVDDPAGSPAGVVAESSPVGPSPDAPEPYPRLV